MADETTTPVVTTKPWWSSKTLIVNAVLSVTALFAPGVNAWVQAHPSEIVMIFAFLNMLLRFVSKDKIVIGE